MRTLTLALLAMLIACGSNAEQSVAQVPAMQWLATIDEGNYAKSWDESSAYFQANVSRDDWVAALTGIRKPLGALQSRKVKKSKSKSSLPGAPDGEYSILILKSSFTNKRKATETVTMVKQGTSWKAVGYFIK